ncbi:hypothetical protein [Streptococcus sp. NLN76]|nr:hypothetical protein [Streptococcus sp. NLN76]MBF8969615.1 hypothetical protein [Streptococcus sp. NLN76]
MKKRLKDLQQLEQTIGWQQKSDIIMDPIQRVEIGIQSQGRKKQNKLQ